MIAGVDEAGRGALAGPVVAAAVILPLDMPDIMQVLAQVDDSKQLTPEVRAELYELIMQNVLAYGVGACPAQVIDDIGILPATKRAMATAVSQLTPAAEYLLIDGLVRLQNLSTPQQSIVRGDATSLSIAAASILAKVTRDRHMVTLDASYPQYGFARHKGYGTRFHCDALDKFGPCLEHRHSFSPIRKPLL